MSRKISILNGYYEYGDKVIDWIYNYFRVYFSFDQKEENIYGVN